MGDKLHRREGNSLDHQLRPLKDSSVIKEVGVQRQPGGLPRAATLEREKLERPSTKGYLYPKPTQVKEVGNLITREPATEAPVNGGRNYNGPKVAKFLIGLGGRRIRPPSGGPEPSVRYHSGRARILTLCQDLRAKGQSQVWHLDVGSSPPGAVVCSKGWAVRPLKRYVSWVQNVVRQFGPYPVWALEH
ncbi:hypothetical protein J1N35_024872 [Gossypium stocksii]|uniref:Uncharacterized protein n=1 Tax=Gossypium stocksii TaxID=47602 RepID=A0A9D3ZXA0_9ROSI|nr:hypothetical protein J1N35_024872 [Gossypium stocksii]